MCCTAQVPLLQCSHQIDVENLLANLFPNIPVPNVLGHKIATTHIYNNIYLGASRFTSKWKNYVNTALNGLSMRRECEILELEQKKKCPSTLPHSFEGILKSDRTYTNKIRSNNNQKHVENANIASYFLCESVSVEESLPFVGVVCFLYSVLCRFDQINSVLYRLAIANSNIILILM